MEETTEDYQELECDYMQEFEDMDDLKSDIALNDYLKSLELITMQDDYN